MNLKAKHKQTIEQLVLAIRKSDEQTAREIVMDQSIGDHEAIFIVAETAKDPMVDVDHLGRWLFQPADSVWITRERMAGRIEEGGIDGVIRELAAKSRDIGCCLVALICDWQPSAAKKFTQRMEYLHDHPEKMNV